MRVENNVLFRTLLVVFLFLIHNTIVFAGRPTRMSKKSAYKKTPLKYFTTKINLKQTSADYLGSDSLHQIDATNSKLVHKTKTPIIPFYPMATDMNFDIVLSVKDSEYSMYEIIRVDLPNGVPAWLTLDSKFDGTQFVGLPKNKDQALFITNLANKLGVKTYQSDLEVSKVNIEGERSLYNIRYNRIDPQGKVKTRVFDIDVSIPTKFDIATSENKALYPKIGKRNSHGMNHSESKLLGLIDIYKTLPFSKILSMKVKFKEKGKVKSPKELGFKFQKILGIPVKTMMAQTVVGLGTNKVNYGENSNYKLIKTSETDSQSVYTNSEEVIYNGQKLVISHATYIFDKSKGKENLRTVELRRDSESKVLSKIEFNPALVDLRYELPKESIQSRIAITVDGKDGVTDSSPLYYRGVVHMSNNNTGNGHSVEIVPGSMDRSHRERFNKTPEWHYKRPRLYFY